MNFIFLRLIEVLTNCFNKFSVILFSVNTSFNRKNNRPISFKLILNCISRKKEIIHSNPYYKVIFK